MRVDAAFNMQIQTERSGATGQTATQQVEGFASTLAKFQVRAEEEAALKYDTHSDSRIYDFTKITPKNLHTAVGALTKSGQMDLDESSSLLCMMAPANSLSRTDQSDGLAPHPDLPVNVFAKIQAGIEGAASRNEQTSVAGLQKAADALRRFQVLR